MALYLETPATAIERVFFATRDVHEKYPSEIKITWEAYNLTSNLDANIQISLWGYRETTIKPEFEYIDVLEVSVFSFLMFFLFTIQLYFPLEQKNIANSGSYTIVPRSYRSKWNPLQQDMTFGFIQINLTEAVQYSGLEISP